MDTGLYSLLGGAGFTHPLHPVLITMVVGPVIAAFLFQAGAMLFKKPEFAATARQLTVVALVFWFPTVAVGVLDWQHFYGGSPKMAEIPMKMALAGALFVLLLGNILAFRLGKKQPFVPLALLLLATLTVSALGYFGGEIVFGGRTVSTTGTSTPAASTDSEGYKTLSQDGYSLAWRVHDGVVDVKETYATNGWVGFGIGKTGTMEGSHIILGFVLDGKVTVADHFGLANHRHEPEEKVGGKDSLTARGGSFADGKTTITFTLPLQTGNPQDPVLAEGETYKVLLANGGEDAADLESYHGRSGRIVVDLTL